MKSMQFETKDENNNKIICDVIATYHHDETNKDFIVYTDRTLDKNHKLKLFYSLYEKVNDNIKLIKIENTEDRKIGLQLIQELIKDLK